MIFNQPMDVWGAKALHAGEKHHVAWCFPTLNDFCMQVDCLYLPSVVNDSASLEVKTQLMTPV